MIKGLMGLILRGSSDMLWRLFRLPPVVYFVLAPIFVVLGIALFIQGNSDDAERAAALSHAAPEPVALQDVASGDTGSEMNEIVLVAQADFDNAMVLERTKRGRTRSSETFIPLYATDAADFSAPVAAVMEIDGSVSDEALFQMYVEDGPAGPIFAINGLLDDTTNLDVPKAFEGIKAVSDGPFYTVRPFLEGREEGLKPRNAGTGLLIFALVIAALLGGYGYFRKTRLDAAKEEEDAPPVEG